jgi:hypothetical protein
MILGASELFSTKQISGLNKLGDIIMPENGEFPAFSKTGCAHHIDIAMMNAHPDDVRDFGFLLLFCYYSPAMMIRLILDCADNADRFPFFITPLLRKLNIGIKGVVVSLYYSGENGLSSNSKSTLDVIDFNLTCTPTGSKP